MLAEVDTNRSGCAVERLVPVHGNALRVPAQFAIRAWRDRAAARVADRAVLEREQLLRAEGLVVDLRGSFNKILQVGASEEVAERDEFAVGFILDCKVLVSGAK